MTAILLNTAETKTSGVDLEVGYSYEPGRGNALLSPAEHVCRQAHQYDRQCADGSRRAGGLERGIPHWRGNLGMNYRTAKYDAGILYRYVQGGKYDNTFIEVDGLGNVNSINDNTMSGRGYIDLNGSYKITENFDVFAKVNNLLDKDPPATPNVITQAIYAAVAVL